MPAKRKLSAQQSSQNSTSPSSSLDSLVDEVILPNLIPSLLDGTYFLNIVEPVDGVMEVHTSRLGGMTPDMDAVICSDGCDDSDESHDTDDSDFGDYACVVHSADLLQHALANDDPKLIEALVAVKGDVNANIVGFSAAFLAEQSGKKEVLRALTFAKANIDTVTANEALSDAILASDLQFVQALIEAKADAATANSSGWTPLTFAARRNHVDILEFLLTCKADIDVCIDDQGSKPIDVAAHTGCVEAVQALVAAKASVDHLVGVSEKVSQVLVAAKVVTDEALRPKEKE